MKASPLRVLVVRHSQGGEAEGRNLCDDIRRQLRTCGDTQLVLFHDATAMSLATTGYAKAFMELDRELASRVTQIVCAIPNAVPRMLAWTVAVVSSKEWKIFKSAAQAREHLAALGFVLPEENQPAQPVQLI